MHAKDSQHDCRTRSQSAWKTSARYLLVLFFFLFFSFFCSPGVHTQRFAIVGSRRYICSVDNVCFWCKLLSRGAAAIERIESAEFFPVGGRKINLGLILEQNKIVPCKSRRLFHRLCSKRKQYRSIIMQI